MPPSRCPHHNMGPAPANLLLVLGITLQRLPILITRPLALTMARSSDSDALEPKFTSDRAANEYQTMTLSGKPA